MADLDPSRAVAALTIYDPSLDWEALVEHVVMIACEAQKGEHTTSKVFVLQRPVADDTDKVKA